MDKSEQNKLVDVETALDAALIVMRNGGSTETVNRTFQQIIAPAKLACVAVAWRLDHVLATSLVEGGPHVVLRLVGPIGVNLMRVAEATDLGKRVERGEVKDEVVASEVNRIATLLPPYNRWIMVAAAAFTAAMFSQIPGGDWGAMGIAFVSAGVGQLVRSFLQARQLAVSTVTLICGALSACMAGLGLRLGMSEKVPPTLIASVIYLVPGLPLINGFIDMVSHRYLFVGLQRIANAAFLFLVLAVAIAFAYSVVM